MENDMRVTVRGVKVFPFTSFQQLLDYVVGRKGILVAINAEDQPYTAHFDAGCGQAVDLISGDAYDFGGGSELPPYSAFFWRMEH